jgi:hypothetical protein
MNENLDTPSQPFGSHEPVFGTDENSAFSLEKKSTTQPSAHAPSPTHLEDTIEPATEQVEVGEEAKPFAEIEIPAVVDSPATPNDPTLLEWLFDLFQGKRPVPALIRPAELAPIEAQPQINDETETLPDSTRQEQERSIATAQSTKELTPTASISLQDTLRSWLIVLTFSLALFAQWCLMPEQRESQTTTGILLYILSAVTLVSAVLVGVWKVPQLLPDVPASFSQQFRKLPLGMGVVSSLIAFALYSGNRFTRTNLTFSIIALLCFALSIWYPELSWRQAFAQAWKNRPKFPFQVTVNSIFLLVVLATGVSIFFRMYRLDSVPPDMISDHAEKLFDVSDLLNGEYKIFFERNTGREAVQFYTIAFFVKFFNTGLTFLSMKLGTSILGLFALIYLFLLAKETSNWQTAVLAVLLCGIAYWPNVQARFALRYMYTGFFIAPVLYHLIVGLRRGKIFQFALSGIFLGLGLQGYSSFRLVPILVVLIVAIYMLHQSNRKLQMQALWGLGVLVIFSLVIFSPLLNYMLSENGQAVMARANRTLIPDAGQQVNVLGTFLDNEWKVLTMFFYSNGNTWPHSIPFHPAMDLVTAALYFIGFIVVTIRYVQNRHWFDLGLLVSLVIMLLPSSLSIAFPAENPSLNRTTGAIFPAFLIAAIGLEGWARAFWLRLQNGFGHWLATRLVVAITGILLFWSALNNYDMLFNQYNTQFTNSAWNTRQMGDIARTLINSGLSKDAVWVMTYPHWADSRNVALASGIGARDVVLDKDGIQFTTAIPGQKLFFVKPPDVNQGENDPAFQQLQLLRQTYPDHIETLVPAKVPGREFILFWVLK